VVVVFLTLSYIGLMFAVYQYYSGKTGILLNLAHEVMIFLMWVKRRSVMYEKSESMYAYYMFIWKLFFCEFGLFIVTALI